MPDEPYFDPLTGLQIGAEPAPSRGAVPDWTIGSLAQQSDYKPAPSDVWSREDRLRALPDVGAPAIDLGSRGGDVARDVAADRDMWIPQEPWEYGLSAFGPAGRIAGKVGKGAVAAATAYGQLTDDAEAKARLFKSPFSAIGQVTPVHDVDILARRYGLNRSNITPSDLEGSYLLPLAGDRAAAMGEVLGVGGTKFDMPTWLQGGRDYPLEMAQHGAGWASAKTPVTRLNTFIEKQAGDAPVHGVFTAMGEKAIDFSHHVSDTLVSMAQHSPITDKGLRDFDSMMKEKYKDWPGILSHRAHDWLASAPGEARVRFTKGMDKAEFRDAGFPRVDQARYAATDPELIGVRTGASGGSVTELTGRNVESPLRHRTYDTVMGGKYKGELGHVPFETMYPDLAETWLATKRPDMVGMSPAQRDAAYVSMVMNAGYDTPLLQKATPQWVDKVSKWLEDNPNPLIMGNIARQY